MQYLTDRQFTTLKLQTYTDVDYMGDFTVTQNSCVDGYVMREDTVTLTLEQAKELLIILNAFVADEQLKEYTAE